MQNTIMTIYVIHNPLSFPQPKCFRRSRLPRRAVLQLHLTPPTSSPHGILSPTPIVTVASISASLPSSSRYSARASSQYRASSTQSTSFAPLRQTCSPSGKILIPPDSSRITATKIKNNPEVSSSK